jgi:nucleotide-binding universal stress UspA family protein
MQPGGGIWSPPAALPCAASGGRRISTRSTPIRSRGRWISTRRWSRRRPRKYLDHIRCDAVEGGVACSVLCIEHDKPYEAIVDTAKGSGCDLVVMASHGLRGVSAILGSETLKVLTHTSVPILVFR